jgi:hypothetical protein
VDVLCYTAVRARARAPTPLLHCAWLVVRVGVLYRIVFGGDPRTPFFSRQASQVRFVTSLAVHCLCVCCNLHTRVRSVSMRRRILLSYSGIHQRCELRTRYSKVFIEVLFALVEGSAPKHPPCRGLDLRRRPLSLSQAPAARLTSERELVGSYI